MSESKGSGRSLPATRDGGRKIEVPDLHEALHRLLSQIPPGRVTTYGALAEALGAVAAARWVASYLLDPRSPPELPRHRVVLRDGRLGESRSADVHKAIRLLKSEGVAVVGRSVDLARHRYDEFTTRRPLLRLQKVQERLFQRIELRSTASVPKLAGGVDVSYVSGGTAGPAEGVAAYVLVDTATGKLLWSHTVRQRVAFPYIPGFLAFREVPILRNLLSEVGQAGHLAPVVFVDGNGILHQRHAGIASHLGVTTSLATIGIGKSLLCGSVDVTGMGLDEARPVLLEGQPVAWALKTSGQAKPIFVSAGHRVDLPFALAQTRRLICGRRLPEPIRYAHAISRSACNIR